GEAEQRLRIAEQHRRVEHVRAEVLLGLRRGSPARDLTGGLLCCTCGHDPLPTRDVSRLCHESTLGPRVAYLRADPTGHRARCLEGTTGRGVAVGDTPQRRVKAW